MVCPIGEYVVRFWLLCFALIFAGCTSMEPTVQPTLRGPIVPTRDIPTNTATPTASNTPLPTDTPTSTFTPSPTATNTATWTLTPTDTATFTPTFTNTVQPSDTPTFTLTPSDTAQPSATFTPSNTATLTVQPTDTPTIVPTLGEGTLYRSSTSLQDVFQYGSLTLDNQVSGTIDNQHPWMLYTFQGTAGMVIHVEMRAVAGDLDPYLLILDPKGRELARNDDLDSSTTDAGVIPLTLPETGAYVLVATRYGQEFGASSGNFDLGIELTDPQSDKIGTFSQPISYNSLVDGTLDDTTPQQVYTFRAAAGDVITIQMTRVSGDLDPRVALSNNVGTEIVANDDNLLTGTRDAAIQSYIIPRSGYFAIVAERYTGASNSGDYRVKLALESQGATGLYAVLDPINSTTINDAGDYYINYFAGDEVNSNHEEHTFQALLTFRLPPANDQTVQSATFEMEPCLTYGGGFDALGDMTIYQDSYGILSQARNATRPLPGARVLSTQNTCDSLDLTALVQDTYAQGGNNVQLRLIFRNHVDNGVTDEIQFSPRLLLNYGG